MTDSTPLVIVTGASGRLGSLVVEGFLDAGYRVAGLDRTVKDGGAAPVFGFDAADEASVADAFDRIVRDHGVPSVVVHTVGMWAMKPFSETALSDWKMMMDVNLTSTFLVFREALRRMQGSGAPASGRLIGISSKQGSVEGAAQQAAYSASKAGVKRIVEALAAELSGSGITAHAIAPSMILFEGDDGEGVAACDLVDHCLHLASDAGASLNGATLHAFGG